jgi:hypothetical protein
VPKQKPWESVYWVEPKHTSYEEARAKRKAYDAARYGARVAQRKCVKCGEQLDDGYTERTCASCLPKAKDTTNTHCRGCNVELPTKFRYKRCLSCRSMYGRRGKYA